MSRINIAFDIDGTIIDIYESVKREVEWYKDESVDDATGYIMGDTWNINNIILSNIINTIIKNYNCIPIYEYVYEVMKYLHDKTDDYIQFITSRSITHYTYTHMLLKRILKDIPFQIAFSENKIEFLNNYDFFMDDRRKTVLELSAMGKTVFMPTHCYNNIPDEVPNVIKLNDKFNSFFHYIDECIIWN